MKKRRLFKAFLSTFIIFNLFSTSAMADTGYNVANSVSPEMCNSSYWTSKIAEPDKIIMNSSDIENFNKSIINTSGTNMANLECVNENFNGVEMVNNLSNFTLNNTFYINGNVMSKDYIQNIRNNIKNSDVSISMTLKYGIVVNRTVLKYQPDSANWSWRKDQWDWNENSATSMEVNTPVVVYFQTADKKFSYIRCDYYNGWVSNNDIAICQSREEWLNAKNLKDFIVVTAPNIRLEKDEVDSSLSEKFLGMGTKLELVKQENLHYNYYRTNWFNYTVKIPVRNSDGSYGTKLALVPVNRDVHVGYLDYTRKSTLDLAFKYLGNRYGWGGSLNSRDCSELVMSVYSCFGFKLPRDVSTQSKIPTAQSVANMTDYEKSVVLDNTPAGAILQFKGHEMLYLGKVNGKYYILNASGSINSNGVNTYINTITIYSLDVLRANGVSFYSAINNVVNIK